MERQTSNSSQNTADLLSMCYVTINSSNLVIQSETTCVSLVNESELAHQSDCSSWKQQLYVGTFQYYVRYNTRVGSFRDVIGFSDSAFKFSQFGIQDEFSNEYFNKWNTYLLVCKSIVLNSGCYFVYCFKIWLSYKLRWVNWNYGYFKPFNFVLIG